ncbi:MAG: cyclic nucleotide-binding domain-containing protein [Actinobacteria bacterium]|jgi:CRP-like cAMP-binding protein|nr:cyclic nucleotide-binding domain-containing protein [Actinomycetota bacterium]
MSDLLALSSDLPLASLDAGDILIAEGTDPTRMFILVSGAVTIERDGVAFARGDTPGSVFGEMSVVLGKPATATVRATTDVEVRVIDDPEGFLIERPGAALHVLRTTAARLDGLTQYLVDVKSQFAGTEGHLGMVDQILDTLVHHQVPAARTGSARDPEGDHQH